MVKRLYLMIDKEEVMVDVICYGRRDTWEDRNAAIRFYLDGMSCCEGSERDRYTNVYLDLISGKDVCSDGFPERR